MSWNIGPFIGHKNDVVAEVEKAPVTQEQAQLAKDFILGTLAKDQSWGNTGIKVSAYGHSAKEAIAQTEDNPAGTTVEERHGGCKIEIEHFKLAPQALATGPGPQ